MDQRDITTDFPFPLLTLYSIVPTPVHFITFSFISISVSFPLPLLGALGGTWRVKANTAGKKVKERGARRRTGEEEGGRRRRGEVHPSKIKGLVPL